MIKSIVFPSLKNALITLLFVGILFFNSVNSAWAKRPPEIRNQQDLNLEPDMHGQDLSGNEYVKFDLNGFNFSDSNLEGAVFNNSKLQNSKFTGANLRDALAYATDFTDADLSDVNFTNALLMESNFEGAKIDVQILLMLFLVVHNKNRYVRLLMAQTAPQEKVQNIA